MKEFNTRAAEGNYSITFETDDRKAFEQVQTLCRILIDGKDSEVIPVEWIKEQLKKEEYRTFLVDYIEWGNCLRWLLEKWEEENETN